MYCIHHPMRSVERKMVPMARSSQLLMNKLLLLLLLANCSKHATCVMSTVNCGDSFSSAGSTVVSRMVISSCGIICCSSLIHLFNKSQTISVPSFRRGWPAQRQQQQQVQERVKVVGFCLALSLTLPTLFCNEPRNKI